MTNQLAQILGEVSIKDEISLHPQTFFMSEIFLDIPLNSISVALNEANGDLERTSEYLLNYDIISKEKIEEQNYRADEGEFLQARGKKHEILEPISLSNNKISISKKKLNNIPTTTIASSSLSDDNDDTMIPNLAVMFDDLEDILETLDIDRSKEEIVKLYYLKNRQNVNHTLLDMIKTYKPYQDLMIPESIPQPSSSESSSYFSDLSSPEKAEMIASYAIMARNEDLESYGDYIHGPKSDAVKELAEIRRANVSLHRLNDDFYKSALKFFKGNTLKVVEVASRLVAEKSITTKFSPEPSFIEEDFILPLADDRILESHTREESFKEAKRKIMRTKECGKSAKQLLVESKLLKNQAIGYKNREVKGVYSERSSIKRNSAIIKMEDHLEKQIGLLLYRATRENRVDLHGLTVENARICAEQALKTWWDDEMRQREEYCDNMDITVALYKKPFRIITGRGLHSGGGIAKIKTSIFKMLKDLNYKFSDEISCYIVAGKKKSRK